MSRRPETERTLLLDARTPCVCTTPFRPGAIARQIERGEVLRFGDQRVQTFVECFAVPLRHVLEAERR